VNAVIPSTTGQHQPQVNLRSGQRRRSSRRGFLHPLIAICAVQAALSLTLVRSNTAFADEADYLWIGHLEIAHWLRGASWPSAYADRLLSGSPVIYPPLGAVADSIAGLAGARILSLSLMLGATIVLYLTASRLIGRGGAAFACALWALSEPVLRLAFATYDPLSVFLTALSAWLAVQAEYRRRPLAFVVAAAAALALANATAYSGIVIDPVVITFAFLVWLPRLRARQTLIWTVCFAAGLAFFFGLLMTASHSSAGLMSTVLSRSGSDHQSTVIVLNDVWGYSGLIIVLGVIGAVTALSADRKRYGALLALLALAAFIVPAAQLRDQTGWSLDKHLAYGIWFAAIAAGYGCSKLIWWLPGAGKRIAAAGCVVALMYLAVNSWESAWEVYHDWANARSFVTAFAPVAAQSHGLLYVSGQEHVAEYYTLQGYQWSRWSQTGMSLSPVSPHSDWSSYYAGRLRSGSYGVIALFYHTTFSSAPGLPGSMLLPGHSANKYQELLDLVGDNSAEPGLPELTLALERDKAYRLVATGPYDSGTSYSGYSYGIYAIWQKVGA